ncbi:hypothetical protein G7L40_19820 [Paenibacillus polymyxa]|uniref:Uncharacterized protein n=1 Tax=Paenibacillus polymyxa TaxID=1406 RepID=A0A378XZS2_PAEPO|nr:hypothetical protein [Paenibacillus polymyxa]MBE7896262.1 hypothetical protein [Paenibacillus polymyxa]MBG9765818.1 hypothetical protein [Paenibacillus polymyxa]MCC3256790.1 hypothetical protein [Paenibacillus polymyxa]QPK54723.1 hypothetical protein G7035_19865 [Paenibacillus polymyxa]QPK59814.1 hypothetical protein G7L40_19820 [Paenibacillus polymyxa]
MQAIIRFGELKLEQFIQGATNNWLIFSPLPYSMQHSSGIDNSVIISATPTIEIIDADLDVAINPQYKYAYSIATDNKLKLAFSKETHADKGSALEALKCIALTYELGNLQPNGNYYKVKVRNSLGEEIHRTTPLTLDQVDKVVATFDDTRDMNTSGFLEYVLTRDFIVN